MIILLNAKQEDHQTYSDLNEKKENSHSRRPILMCNGSTTGNCQRLFTLTRGGNISCGSVIYKLAT